MADPPSAGAVPPEEDLGVAGGGCREPRCRRSDQRCPWGHGCGPLGQLTLPHRVDRRDGEAVGGPVGQPGHVEDVAADAGDVAAGHLGLPVEGLHGVAVDQRPAVRGRLGPAHPHGRVRRGHAHDRRRPGHRPHPGSGGHHRRELGEGTGALVVRGRDLEPVGGTVGQPVDDDAGRVGRHGPEIADLLPSVVEHLDRVSGDGAGGRREVHRDLAGHQRRRLRPPAQRAAPCRRTPAARRCAACPCRPNGCHRPWPPSCTTVVTEPGEPRVPSPPVVVTV